MAFFGAFDGRLYGVNLDSGKATEVFPTDGARKNLHLNAKGLLDLEPFYANNTLQGIMAGLDRIYALGSIVGSPAIADGTLYVGSTDGTLYALG
jgi:hypothetical protein